MPTTQQVYAMLGNEDLWHVAAECHRALAEASIPHSVCGGVAVCLHGYQRNTVDIDLIVQRDDTDAIRASLEQLGMLWNNERSEFQSPGGIAVQFLYAGDKAGKGAEFGLPEPEGELNVEFIEDLPVVRLSRLIEMKIACAEGNVRRTHKDLADVVELIVVRQLDGSFARHLHPSVRETYRKLARNAQGNP